ncbi:uncharacterized protein V1516DRAFT_663629 [Lipomyces oligophaga]|uniref:uncharacterized protein n=1 Tax=Lipomyces oligophaga TaxID=45792 RepID=UPI0034CF5986
MIRFAILITGLALPSIALTTYWYDLIDIPVHETPFSFPSHNYRVYPRHTSFRVDVVGTWGRLNDYNSFLNRQDNWINIRTPLVTFCPIGNQSFWFEGYSWTPLAGDFSTTLSIGKSSLHPNQVVDRVLRPNYTIAQSRNLDDQGIDPYYGISAIESNEEYQGDPYSEDWTEYPSPRWQPRTFCVPIDDSSAVQFWQSCSSVDSICHRRGSFMIIYTVKDNGTTLRLFRQGDLISDVSKNEYEYGLFGAFKVHQVVYLYAVDHSSYGQSRDVLLARAPVDSYQDKSTWTYWNNQKQTWTAIEPKATVRRDQTYAIYSLPDGDSFAGPSSIFYSDYHHAYLMVFVSSVSGTSTYIVEYAPTPVGPWTTNKHILYKDANYTAGLVTPAIFSTPLIDAPSGKQLMLTPSGLGSDQTNTYVQKLIFA